MDNKSYANLSINGWKVQVVILVKGKNTMESQKLLKEEGDTMFTPQDLGLLLFFLGSAEIIVK